MNILSFSTLYQPIIYALVYSLVSLAITFYLDKKHKFDNIGIFKHYLLVGLGVVLPLIDLIETWIGIGYEANPFFIQNGFNVFLMSYALRAGISLSLGWISKNKNNRWYLALACINIMQIIVIIMNLISLIV